MSDMGEIKIGNKVLTNEEVATINNLQKVASHRRFYANAHALYGCPDGDTCQYCPKPWKHCPYCGHEIEES